jgi:hypothetical protein
MREELFAHKDRQAARLKEEREKLRQTRENEETAMAASLDDKDIDFVASTRVKMSQKEILQMYVGNWADLDLKQRRKVMGYVQAQRSKHAKEIFLKELSALGRRMNQQKESIVEDSRVKGRKDPLKLKLEAITQ